MPEVMQPLSTQDIESELSYAYIHAVAAFAGMNCVCANRVEDGNGIDARVNGVERAQSGDTGYLILNGSAFESPPPGDGVNTVTCAVPATAMSAAVIVALS